MTKAPFLHGSYADGSALAAARADIGNAGVRSVAGTVTSAVRLASSALIHASAS